MTDGSTVQTGGLVRQFRRQRNMTQAELGSPRYSKSYVSAVEKNTIRPSPEALQFFAEKLHLPRDYFATQTSHPESRSQEKPLPELPLLNSPSTLSEMPSTHQLERIEAVLSSGDLNVLPPLEPRLLASLPLSEQASYFYAEGMIALKKQEYKAALSALERALPFASAQLQPFVCDALGQHSYLTSSFSTALRYHLRALSLARQNTSPGPGRPALFTIALHCGEDYHALGAYREACDMYTLAQAYLTAENELKSAALLYFGLGYCTYSLIYEEWSHTSASAEHIPLPEVERNIQRASEYVTQSRDLAQVCSDQFMEIAALLLLTVIKLDFSNRRRQLARTSQADLVDSCAALLDDAKEQCEQVLNAKQNILQLQTTADIADIYEALAYLVRILTQRATLERLCGHDDKALHMRVLATNLCNQALDALEKPSSLVNVLQAGFSFHDIPSPEGSPILPCLHRQMGQVQDLHTQLIGKSELYYAAGEAAEELGRAANQFAIAHECYLCADQYFHAGLTLAFTIISSHEREPGYLLRFYQHYASVLEERASVNPEIAEETHKIASELLKNGLAQMQKATITALLPFHD